MKRQNSTHLTLLKVQNTKTSQYKLSKNHWVIKLLENFGSIETSTYSVNDLCRLEDFPDISDSINCVPFKPCSELSTNVNCEFYFNFAFFHCVVLLFGSVRSSNSHPDLLMTQHHHPSTFSDHAALVRVNNFHFLSHYSYKGNHVS